MRGAASRLFAYGSLMLPEVFVAVCGTSRPGTAATLRDHACRRLRGLPYPGLIVAAGSSTGGLLYSAIDAALWARLDAYEGDDYQRVPVTVRRASDGRALGAHVYLLRATAHALLEDAPWSLDQQHAGVFARYLG